MTLLSRLAFLTLSVLGAVCVDQSSKLAAYNNLRASSSLSYFDGMFNLVYAENTGTMLSVGSTLPEEMRFILFVVFVGIALAAAAVFVLLKPLNTMTVLALSLVIGGGTSNLIDRLIRNGSVIDFMAIRVGAVESGIFNVADVIIILGTSILCLSLIRAKSES